MTCDVLHKIQRYIEVYFSPLGMWIRTAAGGLDVNHSVGRAQAVGSDGRPMTRVKVGLLENNVLMQSGKARVCTDCNADQLLASVESFGLQSTLLFLFALWA